MFRDILNVSLYAKDAVLKISLEYFYASQNSLLS